MQLARGDQMREPGPDGKMDLSPSWYISRVDDKEVVDEKLVRDKFLTPKVAVFDFPTPIKVLSAACGAAHLLVAGRPMDGKGDTLVFSAGLNSCGQLGLVTPEDDPYIHKLTPVSNSHCENRLLLYCQRSPDHFTLCHHRLTFSRGRRL